MNPHYPWSYIRLSAKSARSACKHISLHENEGEIGWQSHRDCASSRARLEVNTGRIGEGGGG